VKSFETGREEVSRFAKPIEKNLKYGIQNMLLQQWMKVEAGDNKRVRSQH
jgi:hypothetical protein